MRNYNVKSKWKYYKKVITLLDLVDQVACHHFLHQLPTLAIKHTIKILLIILTILRRISQALTLNSNHVTMRMMEKTLMLMKEETDSANTRK
jgi:hypothetical protein